MKRSHLTYVGLCCRVCTRCPVWHLPLNLVVQPAYHLSHLSVWMLTQINFITHSFCILFLKYGSTEQMRHLFCTCAWLRKRVYVETCWKTAGKSAQMSKSQMSRLSPYAICVIGSLVMTDVAGLWNCWPLAWDLEEWFWFCSGCWVCQPSSLFFYIAEHPLAEWESLGSQSWSCQSHSDLCSNYCPPVGVLGLLKDKVFLEQELWVNLSTSAQPRAVVLQKGRPRLEVLGVRQLLRFTKWGLLNCDSLLWAGVKILSKDTFRLGEIKTQLFFAFFLNWVFGSCAVPSKTRRGYEIPLLGTVATGELSCACWDSSLWPQYSVILYQECYLEQ